MRVPLYRKAKSAMAVRALRNTTLAEDMCQVPPIWREAFWPADWIALRLSPVYHGYGVPKGDGSPVVVVPVFLCSDAIMLEMHGWLGRVGYEPYLSGIGRNIDCPNASARRLLTTVERAYTETGRKVRIVGHSLGGLVGRAVAEERPELVSQLIYVGSPIQGVDAHPAVTATATMLLTARSFMGGGCKRRVAGVGARRRTGRCPQVSATQRSTHVPTVWWTGTTHGSVTPGVTMRWGART
jgi:pimeloyl-ACP methyl ester carboxylesterase